VIYQSLIVCYHLQSLFRIYVKSNVHPGASMLVIEVIFFLCRQINDDAYVSFDGERGQIREVLSF